MKLKSAAAGGDRRVRVGSIDLTSGPALGEAIAPMLKRLRSIDATLLPPEQVESQSKGNISGIGC
jgi:hypothetical protein